MPKAYPTNPKEWEVSFVLSALNNNQPTLWEEIWEYLYNAWFSPNALYLENINLGTDPMAKVRMIVFGLFVGVVIASFVIVIDKRVLGKFIRKLLSEDCTSPDKAKSLYELGFGVNYTIRNSVRRGTTVRNVVRCVEEEEYIAKAEERRAEYEKKRAEESSLPAFKELEYKVNPDADRFYIPEAKKDAAAMRFEKKGTNWGILSLVIIISAICFLALLFLIPEILKLLDDLLGLWNN